MLRGFVVSIGVLMAGCAAAQTRLPPAQAVATATAGQLRLVVIGDTGVYDAKATGCEPAATAGQQPEIAAGCRDSLLAAMKAERPDAVLDLGDLVYEVGPVCRDGTLTAEARAQFDQLILPIARTVGAPLVLALGNHDVHHRNGFTAAEACYLAYAKEHADEIVFPDRNFVLELGLARLVVFDTNIGMTDALAGQIKSRIGERGPWLLMAAHHVWRTYGDKPGQRHGQIWAKQLGVDPDLWLNGHAHFLQFGEYAGAADPSRKVAALTSGAAGKLRTQTECAHPDSGAPGLPACAEDGELYGQSRYGYAVIEVTEAKVRVVFKDVKGAPLFAWERGREGAGAVVPLARLQGGG
jgi:hypothetical protein